MVTYKKVLILIPQSRPYKFSLHQIFLEIEPDDIVVSDLGSPVRSGPSADVHVQSLAFLFFVLYFSLQKWNRDESRASERKNQ